jgi:superfamily II DNA or RNA helicase
MNYSEFLNKKLVSDIDTGIFEDVKLNSHLFDFQKDIVKWSLRRGRAAIFADCGLGKTIIQLEWAHQVNKHTGKNVLILAPLAVALQTKNEGEKFGINVKVCRTQNDVEDGINITNYEMLSHFDISKFIGIVLDESSILKSFTGKTCQEIIESFSNVPFRLACTATPAPNDYMELGNHSEFLGVMKRTEMLSMFFVHDMADTAKWRLKGHAKNKYWKWVSSWAVVIKKPSDLGYEDKGFDLQELKIKVEFVESENNSEMLFAMEAQTLEERRNARKSSITARVDKCFDIVNDKDQYLIWCDYNAEGDQITAKLNDAVQVAGADKPEEKEKRMIGFANKKERILVSKPSICGFGMNFQSCHNIIFLGLSDSYESYYQAIRRCWRFGQKNEVNVTIIISKAESAVLNNIKRKEKDAQTMGVEMVNFTKNIFIKDNEGQKRSHMEYKTREEKGENFTLKLGDCIELIKGINSDSIHYSIYSPPFASLYTYSNSERDMGNCKNHSEFYDHFRFLAKEMHRVLIPGRLMSFHCMNLPTSKERDGYIGINDFRGELIRIFQAVGFIFHSEVCIWKNPVTAMQRTKALGLLHKQIKKDSCMSRQGIPDYLVTMRKHGDNPERVSHTGESFPVSLWQQYASPVWMDINPSDTLQKESARENNDERHICPLQLNVIERGIELWTNPKDIILSPFAGIGSEGYQALKMGRKYIGFELKESYFNCAVNNLKKIESKLKEDLLF